MSNTAWTIAKPFMTNDIVVSYYPFHHTASVKSFVDTCFFFLRHRHIFTGTPGVAGAFMTRCYDKVFLATLSEG